VAAVLAAHASRRRIALTTSGTTSSPLVVVRTTESWWSSFPAYSELSGVAAGSRVWVPGPLTSTMNLFAAVHAAAVGATLVGRTDATEACLTPALLRRHLDDLAPGTHVTVGGDSLVRALADRAEEAGLRVSHYYGAAELSFVAAGRDAESLRAFPGVGLEIRDGEIWVRSPYLAEGRAGWTTVGDRGRLVDGRLVVLGRPDAVTTAGVTVVLADVEHALEGRATSFGVPHDLHGEVLAAVVADPDDVPVLRRLARERLVAGARPRLWFVVADLPLTDAGKVDRAGLARSVAAGVLHRA
jgi:long-chain acyl-CoA synthetase